MNGHRDRGISSKAVRKSGFFVLKLQVRVEIAGIEEARVLSFIGDEKNICSLCIKKTLNM